MKKKLLLVTILVLSLFLVGCVGDVEDMKEDNSKELKIDYSDTTHEVDLSYDTKNPVVEMLLLIL